MVEPTKRKPRRRRSADSESDSGVVAGTSPDDAELGRRAGGSGTIEPRYASNDPNSAAVARNPAALPIVASILARFRTIPASAISRARSVSSNAATTRGSNPRNAERNAARLLRIVDHDSPAWNDSSASRSKSSMSSCVGTPHSSSWYATMRGSAEALAAPDHQHRSCPSVMGGPSCEDGHGTGLRSKSVLRMDGSSLGRAALNTERNTDPDTFLVPSEPISVTLISRPDTPRFRRSSAVIVPTFVRLSRPNQVESWVCVYVSVFHVAYSDPES